MVQHADIRKEVQGRFCVGCAWATITKMIPEGFQEEEEEETGMSVQRHIGICKQLGRPHAQTACLVHYENR